MPNSDPIILFDAACPMCQTLAALVSRRSGLATEAWQDFQTSARAYERLPDEIRAAPADRLRVLLGSSLLEGEDAWSYLISNWRDLAGLDWLAERTGLRQPIVRSVSKAGHFLRRVCRRCPA